MDTTFPKASDLLAVRSRVSWGALAAGAMIAAAIYFVLTLIGIALGMEVAARGATQNLSMGAAIYAIVTLLIAMFFGGWATSRLAVGESKTEAVLYGIILWGTLFLGLIWLFSVGVRTGFGALVGISSGAGHVAGEVAKSASPTDRGILESAWRRYDTKLGGKTFIADLRKAGFTDEQAEKAQAEIKGTITRLRDDPSSAKDIAREAADNPDVREAGSVVAEGARQVTMWTLVGVLLSMATVIMGSLVGSGELFQPIPILGVRRVVTRPTHS